jgi:Dolichol phosphate-mannose biosynthesis regulatory protein (DPM2)
MAENGLQGASDKALGGAMLLTASAVFVYYTAWAILLVCESELFWLEVTYASSSPSSTRRANSIVSFLPANGLSGSRHSSSSLVYQPSVHL